MICHTPLLFLLATILGANSPTTVHALSTNAVASSSTATKHAVTTGRQRVALSASSSPLPTRMQRKPSSSRLFLKSNLSRKRSSLSSFPLKSSIPADSSLGRRPASVATTASSSWLARSQRIFSLKKPLTWKQESERRKRQRLYQELQVTSRTSSNVARKATVAVVEAPMALFATYFCNMAVVTLSVVTVPAMVMEHFATTTTTATSTAAAFVAGVASLAPLGGGVGKIVNGFVCQRLGGRQASWMYLVGMSALSMAMSMTTSLAPIGMILIGYEFLASIQWTSICDVLDQHYRQKPQLMARGIALLSLSSTLGALAAKTIGAGLLQATHWRTVCRVGSMAALVGAAAMYLGVSGEKRKPSPVPSAAVATKKSHAVKSTQSPFATLKSILGNRVFWMVGIAHSLGSLARGSDRLLGPFLQEATSLSGPIASTLTSSVTIGFVFGLVQGNIFSKLESIKEKMSMVKKNYVASMLSILGLAFCGLNVVTKFVTNSNIVAACIALFSGIMASTVSFQFYQFPNLVSANVFPENSAVSLSLLDAAGFFVTAQVLAANNHVLGKLGWSASWTFLAMIFGIGGTIMSRAIQPVLVQQAQNNAPQQAPQQDAILQQEREQPKALR
eukprot:CAMPEP_0178741162 /NCGR_PEP_ID=MMETSP0744-20121128/4980_1 /TAXON_ID=913974 /ORGANISM="Nitzschia punctata, Strain CCMP561" /LENGTH=617 /DNA_ID=CAMNT_0020393991 /DNA_START=144 /DNA_END=1997 /DNA_ORIENTATION=+